MLIAVNDRKMSEIKYLYHKQILWSYVTNKWEVSIYVTNWDVVIELEYYQENGIASA